VSIIFHTFKVIAGEGQQNIRPQALSATSAMTLGLGVCGLGCVNTFSILKKKTPLFIAKIT
jgi:hypothetical protein